MPQACGRMKQYRTISLCKGKGHATSIQANQVSHTMPRLRLTIGTPKKVGNTKPSRCAKAKIMPQALENEDE